MKTVLFAEDNHSLRQILTRRLNARGVYTVVDVSDGKLALDHLKNPEHRVDLVLTDQSMPELTGLELVRAIRADPRLAKLPVILFSLCTPEVAEHALNSGVNVFIDKLATIEEIDGTILRLLK